MRCSAAGETTAGGATISVICGQWTNRRRRGESFSVLHCNELMRSQWLVSSHVREKRYLFLSPPGLFDAARGPGPNCLRIIRVSADTATDTRRMSMQMHSHSHSHNCPDEATCRSQTRQPLLKHHSNFASDHPYIQVKREKDWPPRAPPGCLLFL